MKKNTFLGMDNIGRCCILESLANYDMLCTYADGLSPDDFIHSLPNWSGCDDVQRTLEIRGLKLSDRILKLQKPIIFHGVDHDWGHSYSWIFPVYYIYAVEKKED